MSKNTHYSFFSIQDTSDSSNLIDYTKRAFDSSKNIYNEDEHEFNLGFDSLLANLKKDSLREDSIYEGEEEDLQWEGKNQQYSYNPIQNHSHIQQAQHQPESFPTYNPQDYDHNKVESYNSTNYLNLQNFQAPKFDEVTAPTYEKLSTQSKRIQKQTFDSQPHPQLDQPAFIPKRIPIDLSRKRKTKRKAWLQSEDQKVLELVNKYGQAWALIASKMTGRTGKQVRDRYVNKLKPDIKNNEWTESEDKRLLALHAQFGHKWSKISSLLPGRTEGQVKNRFYTFLKTKVTDLSSESSEGTQSTTQPPSPTSQISDQFGQFYYGNLAYPQNFQNMSQQQQYIPQRFEMNNQHCLRYSQNMQQYSGNHSFNQDRAGYSGSNFSQTDIITKQVINNTLRMIASYVDNAAIKKYDTKGHKGLVPNHNVISNPKAEMLEMRKKNLEFLLAKTMEEIKSIQ